MNWSLFFQEVWILELLIIQFNDNELGNCGIHDNGMAGLFDFPDKSIVGLLIIMYN